VREDETILHFQKSVQIPLFHFPQKPSSIFSLKKCKNYLLKHETHHVSNGAHHEIAFGHIATLALNRGGDGAVDNTHAFGV